MGFLRKKREAGEGAWDGPPGSDPRDQLVDYCAERDSERLRREFENYDENSVTRLVDAVTARAEDPDLVVRVATAGDRLANAAEQVVGLREADWVVRFAHALPRDVTSWEREYGQLPIGEMTGMKLIEHELQANAPGVDELGALIESLPGHPARARRRFVPSVARRADVPIEDLLRFVDPIEDRSTRDDALRAAAVTVSARRPEEPVDSLDRLIAGIADVGTRDDARADVAEQLALHARVETDVLYGVVRQIKAEPARDEAIAKVAVAYFYNDNADALVRFIESFPPKRHARLRQSVTASLYGDHNNTTYGRNKQFSEEQIRALIVPRSELTDLLSRIG